MYLRCALCRYGINRRGVVICTYYGFDKPRPCIRFVPREHALTSTT
jgi:hypothetical protein